VLSNAAPHIYEYYKICNTRRKPGDAQHLEIASPEGVWEHIQFGFEAYVLRREHGEKGVYVSLACNCDWEPEHGNSGGSYLSHALVLDGHIFGKMVDATGIEPVALRV
jgi:hypothetical protein